MEQNQKLNDNHVTGQLGRVQILYHEACILGNFGFQYTSTMVILQLRDMERGGEGRGRKNRRERHNPHSHFKAPSFRIGSPLLFARTDNRKNGVYISVHRVHII